MANVDWELVEYIEIDEAVEDNVFLYDGNIGAWEYAEKSETYGIEADEELIIITKPTQIEVGKYIVDFNFSEEALEEGVLVDEDEVYRIEDGKVITHDMWDNREMVDGIAETDFNTTIWSVDIYKIETEQEEIFCLMNDNGSEDWYEELEDAVETMIDGVDKASVWHFGDDNHKKLKFGDLEGILTVAQDENYTSYIITDNIRLKEPNPAYYFPYLGLTDDGEVVYYSVNNCNVRTNDIPEVEDVYIDVEAVKKEFEMDEDDIEKLGRWFEI